MVELKTGSVMVGFLYPPDSLHPEFMVSMLYLRERDRNCSNVIRGYCMLPSGANICRGRNKLVDHFLGVAETTPDIEWLWMVDSDMTFHDTALDELLAVADPVKRPIVGGLCFSVHSDKDVDLRQYRNISEVRPTVFVVTKDETGAPATACMLSYPKDRLVEVDGTGAAFLLVHKSVFQKIKEENTSNDPFPWFREDRLGNQRLGEDLTFCLLAKKAGFPVFVHTKTKIGHCKGRVVDEETYEAFVGPPKLDFVVTGTGRCGTGYVARLLTSLGISCGHEYTYGLAESEIYNIEGDSSWLALPRLERMEPSERPKVVHCVRNPLHVIRSMEGIKFLRDPQHGEYRNFALENSEHTETMAWILDWFKRCETISDEYVRVEDITERADVRRLVEMVSDTKVTDAQIDAALNATSTDYNSRQRAVIESWDDLPECKHKRELMAVAEDYGYSTTL